jgi:hypothetical protein
VKSLSCGVNLDVVKILNAHVYVWWSLLYVDVLKIKGLTNLWRRISDSWLQHLGRSSFTSNCSRTSKLSVGEMLTVYFGAPSMFITLWFGFDYGTNPPLGTLII